MPGLFDDAQECEAQQLAAHIQAQQAKARRTPKLQPTGECQNIQCAEPLEGARLFCDPECAQAHARQSK